MANTNNRDDFTANTKETLAKRVGYRCSNPDCGKPTSGPNENSERATNIGVAAHICAAAPGGPRYDPKMTTDERKSIDNGIWLCQSCSVLIDRNPDRYTKELLYQWKRYAEDAATRALESSIGINDFEADKKQIEFFKQCFDRSAFQDDIRMEFSMEDFQRAIEDTILALNTGTLRTRDGQIIKSGNGKSTVRNSSWRKRLDEIVVILNSIKRKMKIAEINQDFRRTGAGDQYFYYFHDWQLADWFNSERRKALEILYSICKEAGIPGLSIPKY